MMIFKMVSITIFGINLRMIKLKSLKVMYIHSGTSMRMSLVKSLWIMQQKGYQSIVLVLVWEGIMIES